MEARNSAVDRRVRQRLLDYRHGFVGLAGLVASSLVLFSLKLISGPGGCVPIPVRMVLVSQRLSTVATSEAVDDYLKAILRLGGPDELLVSSNALAEYLKVRPPSVTGMIQKLASQQPALVLYQKSHGVRLTAAGKRRAWELVRHHRLLELFLHDVLKYSWDEVHEEADRLEHFISERFEDRVAAILGNPEIDPHGHSIPDKGQAGKFSPETSLSDWPLETPGIVSSISDTDASALRQFEQYGIKPGVVLNIRQKDASYAVLIRIEAQKQDVRLSVRLAGLVLLGSLPGI